MLTHRSEIPHSKPPNSLTPRWQPKRPTNLSLVCRSQTRTVPCSHSCRSKKRLQKLCVHSRCLRGVIAAMEPRHARRLLRPDAADSPSQPSLTGGQTLTAGQMQSFQSRVWHVGCPRPPGSAFLGGDLREVPGVAGGQVCQQSTLTPKPKTCCHLANGGDLRNARWPCGRRRLAGCIGGLCALALMAQTAMLDPWPFSGDIGSYGPPSDRTALRLLRGSPGPRHPSYPTLPSPNASTVHSFLTPRGLTELPVCTVDEGLVYDGASFLCSAMDCAAKYGIGFSFDYEVRGIGRHGWLCKSLYMHISCQPQ